MDNDILKLLPKKAFKLLALKETFRIGADVSKSILQKEAYEKSFENREAFWKFNDIKMTKVFSSARIDLKTAIDGEKVLKIYFSQFFEKNLPIHIDLRKKFFTSFETLDASNTNRGNFEWIPSNLHYNFPSEFLAGVCFLYTGFYHDDDKKFENGLIQLGMIRETMNEKEKSEMKDLFYTHFGEGRHAPVKFSLENLKNSFNSIFSHFLKEDIPLNPEFAVLGVYLVTLYLTLQDIPHSLNVREIFLEIENKYRKLA